MMKELSLFGFRKIKMYIFIAQIKGPQGVNACEKCVIQTILVNKMPESCLIFDLGTLAYFFSVATLVG